jgi:hypothetical protein
MLVSEGLWLAFGPVAYFSGSKIILKIFLSNNVVYPVNANLLLNLNQEVVKAVSKAVIQSTRKTGMARKRGRKIF